MWERGLKPNIEYLEMRVNAVAPHVGAWIETTRKMFMAYSATSLPMWERGLKRPRHYHYRQDQRSLPMWERGLKHKRLNQSQQILTSLPMWERGLKPHAIAAYWCTSVAPHVGAWIET